MRFNNLADWLAWQETLHLNEIELGLDRCKEVARRMALKQPEYGFISVSGTNGKGSSVAMLSSIVAAAGYKVGTYTSPHLIQYNERVKIDNQPVSDQLLCEAFQRIDDARGEISLTYFEFGTLAAYDIFHRQNVDFAVFEVGLGGRLDAVNMMDADVALTTSIAIDHVDWLGSDRDSIGREKAGIFRSNHVAVCSEPDLPQSIVSYAKEINADLYRLGLEYSYTSDDTHWNWQDAEVTYKDLPRPKLQGEFQLQNAAGVIKVIQHLPSRYTVSEADIRQGLLETEVPGRFQVIPGDVEYVLDVAHNPHAAKVLAEFLQSNPVEGQVHLIIGMLKDKDSSGVISEIAALVDVWHVAGLGGSRGTSSEKLVKQLENLKIKAPVYSYDTVENAYLKLKKITRGGDRVLVAGSFLTVSGVMKMMEQGM